MRLARAVLALTLSIGIVFASVPNLYADETSELILKILVKKGIITEKEVSQMKAEVEKAKKVAEKKIPKGLEQRVARLEDAKDASSWAEKIKLKGDVRYRNEITWSENTARRYRQRVRARLGIFGKVNDQVDAGLRVVSGNNDPVSTNQSLDTTFGTKTFMLDWAYINYKPLDWVNIKGGLFKNPYMGSEMLWDTDLTFGGSVIQLHRDFESNFLPPTELFANIGQFPLEEIGAHSEDPWLFGYQGGFKMKATDDIKWNFAAAFFNYVNVMGWNVTNANTGNTPDIDGTHLGKDFNVLDFYSDVTIKNPFNKIGIDLSNFVPALVLYSDSAININGSSDNIGLLGGFRIGHKKVKDKNQWSLDYNYRYMEPDVQLDAFPDADFHNGTNAQGHNIIFKYGLLKNTVLAAEWYHTQNLENNDKDDYDNRLQLDAIVKF